jgi:hypothetical protein
VKLKAEKWTKGSDHCEGDGRCGVMAHASCSDHLCFGDVRHLCFDPCVPYTVVGTRYVFSAFGFAVGSAHTYSKYTQVSGHSAAQWSVRCTRHTPHTDAHTQTQVRQGTGQSVGHSLQREQHTRTR